MSLGSRTSVRPPLTPRFFLGNAAFVVAMIAVAAWAAWPIYQGTLFLVLAAASTVLGAAIALLGMRAKLSWLSVAAITIGAYLVVGVPLAVPAGLSALPSAWLDLVTGSVFGWKQLVTVSLPVGSYQSLLVPALMVFLFGSVAAFSVAWRTEKLSFITVIVGTLMQSFGLVFGLDLLSSATQVGPLTVAAPREIAIGIVGFLVSLSFLLWRVQHTRRVAIRIAQSRAGIVQNREPVGSVVRRTSLALVVLLVAIVVGASLSPAIGATGDRDVLRAAIDPETTRELSLSPLTDYRSYFTADELNADLFTVTANPFPTARVRLATLSYYDGQTYRAIDPTSTDGTAESAFVRVPFRLQPDTVGESGTVAIMIDSYRGLWLPTVGDLEQPGFEGDRAAQLAAGFFYNAGTASAIQSSGLEAGDTYELETVVPTTAAELSSISKPATATGLVSTDLIPESLKKWVDEQGQSADAAGLSELVSRLRARGYLSHSLDRPVDGVDSWSTELGSGFQASLAGHSMDRIGSLFSDLLEKQASVPGGENSELVAAVGDDEQFAVASALIAQYLGFPSRVVLGFSLDETNPDAEAIPACTDGVCQGKNLTAWTEVQGENGWVAVTTTPQHSTPIDPVDESLNPPENSTVVLPETATEQAPPVANPSGGDTNTQDEPEDTVDYTWLATTLRIVGFSLLLVLIVLAPFAAILFAKARRRRDRRTAEQAEARIVGGWDEYVDTALDHGFAPPTSETRSEVAAEFGTPRGAMLAAIADRAVFGPWEPIDSESDQFWEIVESERAQFSTGMTRRQRWRSALSLRSFTQYLNTRRRSGDR